MFEPIRGGTRGGQAEFKWTDVSADKDRENYLGHSINAPTGRWQKNKDVHWYNRDNKGDSEREEEIRKIKEAEAEALAAALGFGSAPSGTVPVAKAPSSVLSGPNAIAVDGGQHASEKEEKRRKRAERKEEKKARKEAHRESRHTDYERRSRRDRTRSRSPRPSKVDDNERRRYPRRSRSPPPASRSPHATRRVKDYDEIARERDRGRDRQRWDLNSRDRQSARYERD
ncbi:kinase phosphorylation protein-domain-containing protein [Suillus clintonianus]|uniref:kinase phosphorylation protein-domain-containing protein n=1 Tax=Suillus clintonianus TaxID=1904413 RepID=UPI001B880482|nr:kinase phosphorylation protein-domain-containing protein [Suillus clintonianus]KAG2135477.1 kinase phosphorylation protein-domain-containing protein [Suillus clintonianus]